MAQKLHDSYNFSYDKLKVLQGGWNAWQQQNAQDPQTYPIASASDESQSVRDAVTAFYTALSQHDYTTAYTWFAPERQQQVTVSDLQASMSAMEQSAGGRFVTVKINAVDQQTDTATVDAALQFSTGPPAPRLITLRKWLGYWLITATTSAP